MRIPFLLLLSCLISSCTHTRTLSIPVEFGDRQTLYFTGKGIVAGIMMDSLLGGAGIAIGIAIDEGIAKDIFAAIQKANPEFDIRKHIESLLVSNRGRATTKNWQKLTVDRYGFQVVDGDFVVPVLEFTVSCTNATKVPFNLEKDSISAYKVDLATIKNNGKAAQRLLHQGVAQILQWKRVKTFCG